MPTIKCPSKNHQKWNCGKVINCFFSLLNGPGIEPAPQQWPKLLQWQCQILNPLSHQEIAWCLFLAKLIIFQLQLYSICIYYSWHNVIYPLIYTVTLHPGCLKSSRCVPHYFSIIFNSALFTLKIILVWIISQVLSFKVLKNCISGSSLTA